MTLRPQNSKDVIVPNPHHLLAGFPVLPHFPPVVLYPGFPVLPHSPPGVVFPGCTHSDIIIFLHHPARAGSLEEIIADKLYRIP